MELLDPFLGLLERLLDRRLGLLLEALLVGLLGGLLEEQLGQSLEGLLGGLEIISVSQVKMEPRQ